MEITLNNGIKCPMFGLGTWQSPADKTKTAVKEAIKAGYRHIDTAYNYQNEEAVGEAIKELIDSREVKRTDIFITTKLPGIHTRPSDVEMSLNMSLKKLQLDYVDLYLVHSPLTFKNRDNNDVFPMENGKFLLEDTDLEGVWKEMEKMVDLGKTKSIGVSNFNSKQIERICKIAKILPVTNQVECHAYFPQEELANFCRKWKIVLTAYSPIGSPGRPVMFDGAEGVVLLEDDVVKEIAAKYNKTPAQILLRWLLQRNMIVIPKSVTPERIRDNIKVNFELSAQDMNRLGSLSRRGRLFNLDICREHPEYPFSEPF